ncbi:MAG TPA: hypothetical protein VGB50_13695 [Flavobacterium sp.]|jgi:hypothetical protein
MNPETKILQILKQSQEMGNSSASIVIIDKLMSRSEQRECIGGKLLNKLDELVSKKLIYRLSSGHFCITEIGLDFLNKV